jgi:hypothetical protein
MKLSDIFNNEELSSKEQIAEIALVVKSAREAYGNGEAEITAPEIATVDGLQDLAMLCDDSKVAIAESEVGNIKTVAVEYCKAFEGAKLDKKVEELLAISPILANITISVESEYL